MQELRHASASVQGRRPYNEDRSNALHPLIPPSSADQSASFFAVFDGHGGEEAVDWVTRHLHSHVSASPHFSQPGQRHLALEDGFLACDAALTAATAATPIHSSGTTCGAVLIDSTHLYAANCGDTRAVLSRSGHAPIELSLDHKPTDPCERARIEAAGGRVTVQEIPLARNGKKTVLTQSYVELGDAGLAVSRAFGDLSFKANAALSADAQVITVRPYVSCRERSADDEFVLLASDGLWNFVSTDAVVQFVRARLAVDADAERDDVDDIACKLAQLALDRKSNDNVTVTLIVLPRGMALRRDKEKAREEKQE